MVWYRKAAEQGDTDAQHALGEMYDKGPGVTQDVVEALAWHMKADGFSNAAEYSDTMKYSQKLKAIYLKYISSKVTAEMLRPDVALQCNVKEMLKNIKQSVKRIEK